MSCGLSGGDVKLASRSHIVSAKIPRLSGPFSRLREKDLTVATLLSSLSTNVAALLVNWRKTDARERKFQQLRSVSENTEGMTKSMLEYHAHGIESSLDGVRDVVVLRAGAGGGGGLVGTTTGGTEGGSGGAGGSRSPAGGASPRGELGLASGDNNKETWFERKRSKEASRKVLNWTQARYLFTVLRLLETALGSRTKHGGTEEKALPSVLVEENLEDSTDPREEQQQKALSSQSLEQVESLLPEKQVAAARSVLVALRAELHFYAGHTGGEISEEKREHIQSALSVSAEYSPRRRVEERAGVFSPGGAAPLSRPFYAVSSDAKNQRAWHELPANLTLVMEMGRLAGGLLSSERDAELVRNRVGRFF